MNKTIKNVLIFRNKKFLLYIGLRSCTVERTDDPRLIGKYRMINGQVVVYQRKTVEYGDDEYGPGVTSEYLHEKGIQYIQDRLNVLIHKNKKYANIDKITESIKIICESTVDNESKSSLLKYALKCQFNTIQHTKKKKESVVHAPLELLEFDNDNNANSTTQRTLTVGSSSSLLVGSEHETACENLTVFPQTQIRDVARKSQTPFIYNLFSE